MAPVSQLFCGVFHGRADIDQSHRASFGEKCFGNGPANSTRGSEHHGVLILQVKFHDRLGSAFDFDRQLDLHGDVSRQ
jgi:hypothetical protein